MDLNLNRWDVLVVNKHWLVLGLTTIRGAIKSLFASPQSNFMTARAFNIDYEYLGDDKWNFEKKTLINPVEIDEWLTLPIRPFDSVIHTAKRLIRVPTVIQAQNCEKTHMRDIKLTARNIMERDNYTCQYSGKKLPRNRLNIDHIISRDEWKRRGLPGSPDTWENMVTSDKDLNSLKSNKTLEESGLKLIRKPKAPAALPASALIKEIRYKDWEVFIIK